MEKDYLKYEKNLLKGMGNKEYFKSDEAHRHFMAGYKCGIKSTKIKVSGKIMEFTNEELQIIKIIEQYASNPNLYGNAAYDILKTLNKLL